MELNEALELLGRYGEDLDIEKHEPVADLTAEGYLEALSKLRKENEALARQLERVLEPYLKNRGIFPRRNKEWHETSRGTLTRLALLPDNPHIHRDVMDIRHVLGPARTHHQRQTRPSSVGPHEAQRWRASPAPCR